MKKILFAAVFAGFASAASAQQAIVDSKFSDNWFIGVNGGANVKTTHTPILKNLNPIGGLRIGRWITPSFGMSLEATANFDTKYLDIRQAKAGNAHTCKGNIVSGATAMLQGHVNLMNFFGGFTGETRTFEVIPTIGIGFTHLFNNGSGEDAKFKNEDNMFVGKTAIDFAVNFGSEKQFQAYIEPALIWALYSSDFHGLNHRAMAFNFDRSAIQLKGGLVYKFKNSNGTHGFKLCDKVATQDEVDALNVTINELRDELAKKPKEIIKEVQAPCNHTENIANTFKVDFAKGDATVGNIKAIAEQLKKSNNKISLVGNTSPEGSETLNDRLAQARAEAVKAALVAEGISADRIIIKNSYEDKRNATITVEK